MKTFFNILQTIIKASVIRYPGEASKFVPLSLTGTVDMYTEYSVYSFICKIYQEFNTIKLKNATIPKKMAASKFKALDQFFNNKFNTEKQIQCVFNAFSKAQRVYFAFNKFVNIYKLKKYPKVVTDDLSMTPLDINNKNTFALFQNKSVYLFSLNDLVQIIDTAIGNAPSFFSDPQRPKNPFNNNEFSNATLYNIYFKMKDSMRVISTIFHLYFLSNFNNDDFTTINEPFLREYSIKKYIFTTPALCLHTPVIEMLSANFFTKKLTIHKNFPKEQLVEIFRPFLYYYYIVNYDIRGTHKLIQYKKILHYKLKKFYEYNKAFGRQIIELIPRPINFMNNPTLDLSHLLDNSQEQSSNKKYKLKTKVTFNSKHIGFYNIDVSDIQDIEEGARFLFYFSTNVDYDEDDEYYSSSDEDESLEDTVVNQNTETATATATDPAADPEVSTLESDEYDDDDTEESDSELNDNISTLQREYGDYDETNNNPFSDDDYYDDDDDDDSIS
jgi:hypothetical protein